MKVCDQRYYNMIYRTGKVVIFGGGVPVVLDGTIVGAVGASAGTVEQDIAVAEAAIAALGHQAQSSVASRSSRKGP